MGYTSSQNIILVHAILGGILAMILWPLSAVLARYLRSYMLKWCRSHYIVNSIIGFPILIVVFALGRYHAGSEDTWKRPHDRIGLSLLILVTLQTLFGTIIHAERANVPMVGWKSSFRYLHPVMGIATLALGFYQVWSGMKMMHAPLATPRGVYIAWAVLVGVWGALYLVGFVLLPAQWRRRKATLGTGLVDEKGRPIEGVTADVSAGRDHRDSQSTQGSRQNLMAQV